MLFKFLGFASPWDVSKITETLRVRVNGNNKGKNKNKGAAAAKELYCILVSSELLFELPTSNVREGEELLGLWVLLAAMLANATAAAETARIVMVLQPMTSQPAGVPTMWATEECRHTNKPNNHNNHSNPNKPSWS